MGIFENWPYTNVSNLNLNWIISKIKDVDASRDRAIEAEENAAESASAAYDSEVNAKSSEDAAALSAGHAHDSEVNAKASEDAAKDYADNIADPVSGLVTSWLSDHISNPSSPPIDTSLSVAGSAADAKAAGDAIKELDGYRKSDETILYYLYNKNYKITQTNTFINLGSYQVGDTVNMTPTSGTNFGYAIIPCQEGEEFIITANSGTGHLPWAFVDSGNVVLSIASAARVKDDHIVAPQYTENIIISLTLNSVYSILRGASIAGKMNGEYSTLSIAVVNGAITVNGSETNATSYRRTPSAILLKAGQTIKTYCTIGSPYAAISRWDVNGNFLETVLAGAGEGSGNEQNYEYTAEKDVYIKLCYYNSTGCTTSIKDPTNKTVAEAVSTVYLAQKNELYEWERVLNSVCCIGDSLTKGAYYVNGHGGAAISQNFPYFFSKQSGLPVQNEGYSGSSPSSRWSYFSTYDFTPYNAFTIWWGVNGGLTDTLYDDGVIDGDGNLITAYNSYSDTNTGDYCKVIGRIIDQVPHAKIFLGTVYTSTGDKAVTNQVIEKIAALYPNNVMGVVNCDDGTLYSIATKRLTPVYVHPDNATHFGMIGNYYLSVHWLRAIRSFIASDPGAYEDIMEDILA